MFDRVQKNSYESKQSNEREYCSDFQLNFPFRLVTKKIRSNTP